MIDLDRETIAAAIVGTGGAMLLGSALLNGRSGRWTPRQVKGLVFAGIGFLSSAVAARWLQHWGNGGIAISLVGTMLAMRGMYLLLRERAAERDAARDTKRLAERNAKHQSSSSAPKATRPTE